MENKIPPISRVEFSTRAKQYTVYPAKRTTKIDDMDWDRWIQNLEDLSKTRQPHFLEAGWALFGISVPCLIGAATIEIGVSASPQWVFTLYITIGLASLLAAFICFFAHTKYKGILKISLEGIIKDMKIVHKNAPYAYERIEKEENNEHQDPFKQVDRPQLNKSPPTQPSPSNPATGEN